MFSNQITSSDLVPNFEFTSKRFQGTVCVLRVQPEINQLIVKITRSSGSYHSEEWNLAHTIIGFDRGDYTPAESAKVDVPIIIQISKLCGRYVPLMEVAKYSDALHDGTAVKELTSKFMDELWQIVGDPELTAKGYDWRKLFGIPKRQNS
jgi:hypothetical protein